jgi:hypothetical protein
MKENKMNDNVFDLHKISPLSYSSSINTNELRTNRYSKAKQDSVIKAVATTALLIVMMLILSKLTVKGIDNGFRDQDIMLCHSAKISGNEEYLNKCKCYYEGKDISCIR